jgi:DNA end-binding protein Ku
MARSVFNGTISFALVNVPVKLYSATESKSVRFHQVHLKDGSRIEHKRICPQEDAEVPFAEVVKGFEVGENEYVVMTKDEVAAAAGDRSKMIDIEHFVREGCVDPIFYERTYYLGPGDGGEEAYRLLHDALSEAGSTGIGRMVFHNREYLVAVRTLEDILALHTMRFHDEVVPGGDLDVPEVKRAPSEQELDMAGTLVDRLKADFDPEKHEDTYRDAVLELINRKAGGEKITVPKREKAEESDDLLAALEASLAGGNGNKGKG